MVMHLVMTFLCNMEPGSLFLMLRDIEIVTLLNKLTAYHMVYVKSQIGNFKYQTYGVRETTLCFYTGAYDHRF
jgi:hypothetical protein